MTKGLLAAWTLVSAWLACSPELAAASAPTKHADVAVLDNGVLYAEVMLPDAPGRYNRGVRFTNIGNVLRVVYAGEDYLFSPLDHNPLTENGGLAMEFNKDKPQGYDQVDTGNAFLKIGVGHLEKKPEPYFFYNQYKPIQLAETRAEWSQTQADFVQVCPPLNGYGYRMDVRVFLADNELNIVTRLENIGSKSLDIQQYTHNFFCLDEGATVSDDYTLRFDESISHADVRKGSALVGETTIGIPGVLEEPLVINIPRLTTKSKSTVTLEHRSGRYLTSRVTGVPSTRTFIYALDTYLCPEQFICVTIPPGEARQWQRQYIFGKD